jgi:hypothetical protein
MYVYSKKIRVVSSLECSASISCIVSALLFASILFPMFRKVLTMRDCPLYLIISVSGSAFAVQSTRLRPSCGAIWYTRVWWPHCAKCLLCPTGRLPKVGSIQRRPGPSLGSGNGRNGRLAQSLFITDGSGRWLYLCPKGLLL